MGILFIKILRIFVVLAVLFSGTMGFNLYAVVESYFTDLNKRREINRLLNLEQNICEEVEEELGVYEM